MWRAGNHSRYCMWKRSKWKNNWKNLISRLEPLEPSTKMRQTTGEPFQYDVLHLWRLKGFGRFLQFRLSSCFGSIEPTAVGFFVLLAATSAGCCHLLLKKKKKKKLHACLLHPHLKLHLRQLFLSSHLHLLFFLLARSVPVSRAGKGSSSRQVTPPFIPPIDRTQSTLGYFLPTSHPTSSWYTGC